MDIRFTTDQTAHRADELAAHLLGPRLWVGGADYPDLNDWVMRTHAQLRSEAKRAVVGLSSGALVGAVVYQAHRAESGVVELKNISVHPDARGRYIASFLLRNAEIEGAADYDADRVIVDTKTTNHAMVSFLLGAGYHVRDVRDLYGLNAGIDLVLEKRVRRGRLVRP